MLTEVELYRVTCSELGFRPLKVNECRQMQYVTFLYMDGRAVACVENFQRVCYFEEQLHTRSGRLVNELSN